MAILNSCFVAFFLLCCFSLINSICYSIFNLSTYSKGTGNLKLSSCRVTYCENMSGCEVLISIAKSLHQIFARCIETETPKKVGGESSEALQLNVTKWNQISIAPTSYNSKTININVYVLGNRMKAFNSTEMLSKCVAFSLKTIRHIQWIQ